MSKEVKKLKIPLELDVSVIGNTSWVQIYIIILNWRQDSENFLNDSHFKETNRIFSNSLESC